MTEREKEENRTNISSQSADVLQRAAERNRSPTGAKAASLPTYEISVAQASLTSLWLFHWQNEASKDAALSPTRKQIYFISLTSWTLCTP